MSGVRKFSLESTFDLKYKLSDKTKLLEDGICVHRIIALRQFGSILKGEEGGWVESESNLSHSGCCWIYGDAVVAGDSVVTDSACIKGHAIVSGESRISGFAVVEDDARVYNSAVSERSNIQGFAQIYDSSISGNAEISNKARILYGATIGENAVVTGYASVIGNVVVQGNTLIDDDASVCGEYSTPEGDMVFPGAMSVIADDVYLGENAAVVNSFIRGSVHLSKSMCIINDGECCKNPLYAATPLFSLTATENGNVILWVEDTNITEAVCFPWYEWETQWKLVVKEKLNLVGANDFVRLFNRLADKADRRYIGIVVFKSELEQLFNVG